jgi:colicin import membrane protein
MRVINYRTALIAAVLFHLILVVLLTMENRHTQFVVQPGHQQTQLAEPNLTRDNQAPEPIKAVSVDSQAVEETIHRLRQDREDKQQAEIDHQRAMQQQLKVAEQKRLQEQRSLERLKKEAAQLAIAQKQKRLAEEQQEKHLADLKQQQMQLKQQQALEQKQLAAIQQKKTAEAIQEQARLAQQAAAKQAATAAQQSAQMAGEINKYKSLIIQSISQHWILPEHVNNQLFSQFRIKLAPNGAVLSVSLTRSSGDPILDRSAQAAIYKASPLPVPSDQATFNLFRDISLTVRPQSVRG